MLSKEEIKEFKEIYKKEFNEDIDDETAYIIADRLLNLTNSLINKIN